jgi:hypothetical protein
MILLETAVAEAFNFIEEKMKLFEDFPQLPLCILKAKKRFYL